MLLETYKYVVNKRGFDFVMNQEVENNIAVISKWLVEPDCKTGLLILGVLGNGKTSFVKAIAILIEILYSHDLNESNKKRLNQIEAIDLKYYFRDPQTVDFYKQCDLLAIEDIGTEPSELNIYGNISSPFSEILSYRYKTQLFTIMTTNLTTTELKKYYGSRVADRFKEMCTLVSFKNNSYRGLTTKNK